MNFEWIEDYSVGSPTLDYQHAWMLGICKDAKECAETSADGNATDRLGKILDTMREYAAAHFETEEKLLAEQGFPSIDSHREEHRHYSRQLDQFRSQLGQGSTSVSEVRDYLLNWWISHILGSDMEYRELFEQ